MSETMSEQEREYLNFLQSWLHWRRIKPAGGSERPATPFSRSSTLQENAFWWANNRRLKDPYMVHKFIERRFEQCGLKLIYTFDKDLYRHWEDVRLKRLWLNQAQLEWVESEVTRLGGVVPKGRVFKD
ncbi:hypothetical protein [Delftia phage PhiW-14]|uniref:Uncharacterized protein n=1 Tax=Delftia phage PhiW-14 TaxID=665032 RepID=C9DG87_BPW14|nr:hypothetical protein DP-phiW-14_gp117 [Delftia phage PhiW-14]ACV50138.1 hypothetical protein [Delftia phage PhiW-14]